MGRKHTEETKKILSSIRKEFLVKNPQKHVWRNKNKFISKPCETLKNKFKEAGLIFVEEYVPLKERFFSLDIAFPDKKIGVEVNGNQHYNSDKTLRPYYQKRHDLLQTNGWTILEIHYSKIYDSLFVESLINGLIKEGCVEDIDLSFFVKKKVSYVCKECERLVTGTGRLCISCRGLKDRKFEITKEELEKLIANKPMTEIGKMFGVSDNAIRKRAKKLGIS